MILLFIYLFIYLFVCLFVCLFIYLFIYLSIYLFIYLSPNKYKLPNYYVCINKLLHVCNIFIVFRCVPKIPTTFKTEHFSTLANSQISRQPVSQRTPSPMLRELQISLWYSRRRYGTRSNRIWFSHNSLGRHSQKNIQTLLSSHLKTEQRSSVVLRHFFLFKTSIAYLLKIFCFFLQRQQLIFNFTFEKVHIF